MIEFILSAPFVLSAVIAIVVAIAILLEFEKEGWATTLFSLGTALTLWAYKTEIWDFVSGNPMPTLYFTLSYVAAGVVWSLIKWKNYINQKVNKYEDLKSEFSKRKEIKSNWNDWISCLNGHLHTYFSESWSPEEVASHIVPKANEKKSLIVSWISYWPMSLGATALNNPFRRFFEWIYGMISGIYDKMGSSAASKIASGLEKGESGTKPKKDLIKG